MVNQNIYSQEKYSIDKNGFTILNHYVLTEMGIYEEENRMLGIYFKEIIQWAYRTPNSKYNADRGDVRLSIRFLLSWIGNKNNKKAAKIIDDLIKLGWIRKKFVLPEKNKGTIYEIPYYDLLTSARDAQEGKKELEFYKELKSKGL